MKKAFAVLFAFLFICSISFAEDAISSATLRIEHLPEVETRGNGILVVFFSPDDTVRAAAYTIASALSAELFEIEPVEAYTADDLNYFNNRSRSMVEMGDSLARPDITALPDDLASYHTIILCYPVWGGQAPRIISTFLESVDLTGKTLIPFATSNSSGIGNSGRTLQSLTDDSVSWQDGTGIRKGASEEDIRLWAESLDLGN